MSTAMTISATTNSPSNSEQESEQCESQQPETLHKIPDQPSKATFNKGDSYLPVDDCYKNAIKLATKHMSDESNKLLACAVMNHWSDELIMALEPTCKRLEDIELNYSKQSVSEEDLQKDLKWYKTTLSELAPYGILSPADL
jgi:hypothetical protein